MKVNVHDHNVSMSSCNAVMLCLVRVSHKRASAAVLGRAVCLPVSQGGDTQQKSYGSHSSVLWSGSFHGRPCHHGGRH